MDSARFLDSLAADFDRLRFVASLDPAAPVPTCPGWNVGHLTRHVGEVYLHKALAIRDGVEPSPWPPADLASEEPLELLDRAYAALRYELDTHSPQDHAGTWYSPDQTVGFWIRRMAQETVIHRIDAELGTHQPVVPVPPDLAIDGVDELLNVFLAFSVVNWGSYFTDLLSSAPACTYLLRTDEAAWRVDVAPGELSVADVPAGDGLRADVTISGPPMALQRWVWNREAADAPGEVTVDGPAAAVGLLRRCIVTATQ